MSNVSNAPEGGPKAEATDPVCGMTVDPRTAIAATHAGRVWHFCCAGCRDAFVEDPQRYLGGKPRRDDVPAPPGTRYTCPMHPEIDVAEPIPCPKCGMALEPIAPTLDTGNPELDDMTRRLRVAVILTVPIVLLMVGEIVPAIDPMRLFGHRLIAFVQLGLAAPVVLWCGWPFFQRGWQSLRGRSPNMFTLFAIGSGAAFGYSAFATLLPESLPPAFLGGQGAAPLYYEAAAMIVTLVLLGQVLELRARDKTADAIRALLRLAPKVAHRLDDSGKETDVPLDQVVVGDRLRVRPGENVPVDGAVCDGDSRVDESLLTGEPVPVRKTAGATVTAGTINGSGSFVLRAERVGGDTLLAQIVRLVAKAQRSRAPVQQVADRVAAWFVPAVVAVAIVAASVWALFGPEPRYAVALLVAVSVLIIACPCALGLATPMSIMVAVGRGAREGILIRDASALQRMERITTLVIDKTGTLTEGKPSLRRVIAVSGQDELELLRLAAAVEQASEHPLARAIVAGAQARQVARSMATDFVAESGFGVRGMVDHREVLVGNAPLLEAHGIAIDQLAAAADRERASGATAIFVAIDHRLAGFFVVADAIKDTALEALTALRKEGLRIVMLTGDSQRTALTVGDALGVDEVIAEVRPGDKAEVIMRLQHAGAIVAMAGDGSNDAPALAQADVGIAMGSGTDIAIESAGITLLKGDLRGLVRALRLSRGTMRNIRQNLWFAFAYNALGVPIAAGILYPVSGVLLSPVFASVAMSLSSVSVISNALRLRRMAM
jgi:Cu+-exporting ATPase